MNRLQRVDEATGGSALWHQLFSYDQYGNRAMVSDAGVLMPYLYRTPRVSALTDPLPFVGNRWTDASMTHDAVGNQKSVAYPQTSDSFVFDAENRMTQSTTNAGTVTYAYDAEGHRAKKTTGAGTAYYVYGADGELAAERLS